MESKNKIALVTGGSRGLGKNMAVKLAEKGNDVLITYNNNKQEADSVVAEVKARGRNSAALQLNVGDSKTFDDFFKRVSIQLKESFGAEKFDFLINNAGIGIHASIAATEEEMFDELMNIHLKGVFFLTQKALPHLNDNGRIINLSTGLARFTTPGYAAYASMKGGVEVFTRYLAKEVGSRGITGHVRELCHKHSAVCGRVGSPFCFGERDQYHPHGRHFAGRGAWVPAHHFPLITRAVDQYLCSLRRVVRRDSPSQLTCLQKHPS